MVIRLSSPSVLRDTAFLGLFLVAIPVAHGWGMQRWNEAPIWSATAKMSLTIAYMLTITWVCLARCRWYLDQGEDARVAAYSAAGFGLAVGIPLLGIVIFLMSILG